MVVDPDLDERQRRTAPTPVGYVPNPGGSYEIDIRGEFERRGWPKMYDGKALKVIFSWIHALSVHQYRAVVMLRDIDEIQRSYATAFATVIPTETIRDTIDEGIAILRNRKDVQLSLIQYSDMLTDPRKCLAGLRDDGWPIDAEAAASVVDPKLYRCRT